MIRLRHSLLSYPRLQIHTPPLQPPIQPVTIRPFCVCKEGFRPTISFMQPERKEITYIIFASTTDILSVARSNIRDWGAVDSDVTSDAAKVSPGC